MPKGRVSWSLNPHSQEWEPIKEGSYKMAKNVKEDAPGTAHNSTGGGAFTATSAELASLATARGRKAKDSEYLAEVTNALANPTRFDDDGNVTEGQVYGVKLTEFRKAAWVGPELRKAAKQLGVQERITVRDRSNVTSADMPQGFMLYWVKPEDEVKAEPSGE